MLLLPGARYIVAVEFKDADGMIHAAGESWVYLGCEYRKFFGGYVIYAETADRSEISFRMAHRRLCSDSPTVLDEVEKYLIGPDAPTEQLLAELSPQSKSALERVQTWVEPVPEVATRFMYALERARGNAQTAYDRGAESYAAAIQDLDAVLSEVYRWLSALPPNHSLQARRP